MYHRFREQTGARGERHQVTLSGVSPVTGVKEAVIVKTSQSLSVSQSLRPPVSLSVPKLQSFQAFYSLMLDSQSEITPFLCAGHCRCPDTHQS